MLNTEEIANALAARTDIVGWTLTYRHRHGTQLYVIGREVENLRHVETAEFAVTVHHDHPWPDGRAGHARGVASIKLVAGDGDALETRLAEAVLMASLVNNPPYDLVAPMAYPEVPLADPELLEPDGTRVAAWQMAEEVWAACDREAASGIRLSAAEYFVTVEEREFRTSRGIRVIAQSTRIAVEIALLARDASGDRAHEAETFRPIEARRVADLHLDAHVAEAAAFARDTLRATPTPSHVGAVVISGGALPPLFEPFIFHAGAQAAYMKLGRFSVGDDVLGDQPRAGDVLQLASHTSRPFGLGSHAVDSDGMAGRDLDLIVDGRLTTRHATSRYAQYLEVPVTGETGAVVVAAGTASRAALTATSTGEVIEIVAFSSPNVDDVTGDIGCEIRLGYHHRSDGDVVPIKGGALAGNVFEAFGAVHFGAETHEALISGFGNGGTYVGPRSARFTTLRVAGE